MALYRTRNKYDYYLFFLIISLAFGNIGGAYQVPRVLAILSLPLLIKTGGIKNKYVYPIFLFFIILYAYGLFSLIWTPDITNGLKEAIYLPVHMLFFLEIVVFSRQSNKAITTLAWAWTTMIILTSIIGIWEINTGNHLWLSKFQDELWLRGDVDAIKHQVASCTFGNYNTFVTVLSMGVIFISYAVYQADIKWMQLFGVIGLISIVYIVGNNASRGGVLSVGVSIVVLLWYSMRQVSYKGFGRFFLILSMLLLMAYFWGNQFYSYMSIRTQGTSFIEDESRMGLYRSALEVTMGTYYGLGAGMGGGLEAMHIHRAYSQLWAVHNFFAEFLVDYGIVWFLVLLIFIVKMLITGIRLRDKRRKMVVLAALFTLLPMSVINSGYLDHVSTWAYFSSLFVFVYYERIRCVRQGVLQVA